MIKCECDSLSIKCCDKCGNECCSKCNHNPNIVNSLSIEEQHILFKWILKNLRPITNINYNSPHSLQLIDKFIKSQYGFHIENGAFKGAMHKLGYRHTAGVNWYFNIANNNLNLTKKDLLMAKIIPSTEFSQELGLDYSEILNKK